MNFNTAPEHGSDESGQSETVQLVEDRPSPLEDLSPTGMLMLGQMFQYTSALLRAKSKCFARLCHRLGVRPSVRPSVRHTRELYQNGGS